MTKIYEDQCSPPQGTSMISYLNFMLSIDPSENKLNDLMHELEHASKNKDHHDIAKIKLAIGRYYLLTCDYGRSIDYCMESLDGFKTHEDINGLIIANIDLAHAYNFLSDFVQVGRLNMQLHEMLFQTDDPIAKAYIRLNLAEHAILNMTEHALVIGKMDHMETDIQEICDISRDQRCWFLYCTANILLGYLKLEKKDTVSAIFCLNHAVKLIEDHDLPAIFTHYAYYLLPEAYWLEYKANEKKWTPGSKSASLKKIHRLCNLALNKTKACLFHHGSALRVKAKYLILEGRTEEAETHFLKSIEYCEKLGRRFELGLSFYFYAYLLELTGRKEDAKNKLKAARNFFREVGATIYMRRVADILGSEDDDIACDPIHDQSQTLAAIINISRNLCTIEELEDLTDHILRHALELTGAENGSIFVKNEKEELELKAVKGSIPTPVKLKIMMGPSHSTFYRPFELYIPIRIGNREIGLCYLDKKKSAEEFNGHDTGSIYLFMSQIAAILESCRLTQIINRKKELAQNTISPTTEKKLKKAVEYIRKNYQFAVSRNELAEKLNINADNLGRFFKQYTGYRISEYTNRLRMEEAARRLKETDEKIIDIAFSVGFESLTTFNRVFNAVWKTTPSKYRKCSHKKGKIE